jgi:ribonuclease P protein component
MSFSFPKSEKLCNPLHIQKIFESGKSCKSYPFLFKYRYVEQPGESFIQVVMVVPKKKFSKAVKRNAIKRFLRESYRHQKYLLLPLLSPGKRLHLAIMYMSSRFETQSYHQQSILFQKAIQQLTYELEKTPR